MNLDEQRYRYRALNNWFHTPQGLALGLAFSNQLMQCKVSRPKTILQLGACGENPWFASPQFKNTWLCTPCFNMPDTTLMASLNQLPLQRHTIDLVIVPFMLEIFGQYKNPLDEIDRVLSPMGHVIFLGINPVSLWGLGLAMRRLGPLGKTKLTPHFPWFLKRAFLNQGYQQTDFNLFYYMPPFQAKTWIKRSMFLNQAGQLMPVFPAGFYCLVLQKHETAHLMQRDTSTPLFLPS